MLPLPPAAELVRRVPRVLVGLLAFGLGVAFTAVSGLGLAPWEVFHQGISRITGIPLGTVAIITGALVLFGWIPLRQKIGLGTLMNVTIIGIVIDVTLAIMPERAGSTAWQWTAVVGGITLIGIGSGLYIGAGLGPGPRDGLMTGLAGRGYKMRRARTLIEAIALIMGWLMGGTLGIGTILFAVTVGPAVEYSFKLTALDPVPVEP